MVVIHLDGQFSATIKASGCEIDRAHNCTRMIGEEHLGVQLKVFQFVNLDANILHGAHSSDSLNQLSLFQLMWRPGHDVDFYAASSRSDQPLDDHCILISLVLQKKGILRIIDKLRNALPAVAAAPD